MLTVRLAEELRTEQEHGLSADKALKTLSAQSMELASRLEDVETTALRHGRKIVAKLEERVRLIENELCKFPYFPYFNLFDLFFMISKNSCDTIAVRGCPQGSCKS